MTVILFRYETKLFIPMNQNCFGLQYSAFHASELDDAYELPLELILN